MSLTTTMGIELTWVPKALQIAQDRGVEWEPDDIPAERSFTAAFCTIMQKLIELKNIPINQCHTDPGCVEVSTRPYKRISSLISVYRRLNREATALGLVATADYTGGGGAHIHTGIPFAMHSPEWNNYTRRFALWAAQNPWVAWAFLNTVDDINAEPITLDLLMGYSRMSAAQRLRSARHDLGYYTQAIVVDERVLHTATVQANAYRVAEKMRGIARYQRERITIRKTIMRLSVATSEGTRRPISTIDFTGNKDYMVRVAGYGPNGTVEFRCFEMGDEAKIKRQIVFANAVCSYVERMECTDFDTAECFTQDQLNRMPWSVRRASFLAMLDSLGLDRTEYRRELVQIALRMRCQRPLPRAAVRRAEAAYSSDEGHDADLAAASRAQARHERRQARRGRRSADATLAELDA